MAWKRLVKQVITACECPECEKDLQLTEEQLLVIESSEGMRPVFLQCDGCKTDLVIYRGTIHTHKPYIDNIHAHVQIQYTNEKRELVESLIGVDPGDPKDRQLIHNMLDEYLEYLCKRMDKKEIGEAHEGNGFFVFDHLDGEE